MHVARLKFPGSATEETWFTDAVGDPVFMAIAERPPPWPCSCTACSRSCARSWEKDGG
jgi:hypothetical protein